MKKVLLTFAVMLVATACAFAGNCTKDTENVQSYAHPSMFNTEAQAYSTLDKSTYMVGGQIVPSKTRIGVEKKDSVFVSSWAKDVLDLIKSSMTGNGNMAFDPKMPVLRSELAVMMAEAFAMDENGDAAKRYKDVTSQYWAYNWIYKTLASGIMIGYPSGSFKPDQRVTKAEVFATIAQLINVPISGVSAPQYNGETMKFIPKWANNATEEVVNSGLLELVPDKAKIVNDEYLSKEQVAYLIATLRRDLAYYNKLGLDSNAPGCLKKYSPVYMEVKMNDRVSAKHSNIGDTFTATTTAATVVKNTSFPVGSEVKGEVVQVKRPGFKSPGFIQVKFLSIKNDGVKVDFPKEVSTAKAQDLKNPNVLARLVGMPFSGAGRIVGIVGRSGGTAVNVAGNRLEEFGSDVSNMFVETLTLHPGSGVKSAGYAIGDVFIGIYEIAELAVSGTFGLLYEVGDELLYFIVPSLSNDSALNPNEELTIVF